MSTTKQQDIRIRHLIEMHMSFDVNGEPGAPTEYSFLIDALGDIAVPEQIFEIERLEAWALANGFEKVTK